MTGLLALIFHRFRFPSTVERPFRGFQLLAILLPCFIFANLATGEERGASPATAPSVSSGEGPLPSTGEIVVTANRASTPASDVGSSVSIISRDEIERRQSLHVADILRGTPSLDVVRSGGPNQVTSVFTRGANSDHTLVLIDGIVANDPTSPARAFDFSSLTLDDVDHIEVVRGPQSTLWGSNALGGVVNIVTRRGSGPPSGYIFGEAGSYNTFREGAGVSGGDKRWNYSLAFSRTDSQGFSAADAKFGNKESDGFGNNTASAKLGFNLAKNFDIDLIARYVDADTAIDDNGGPGGDNPNRQLRNHEGFFRIAPHLVLMDGFWEQTFNASYTRYDRTDTSATFPAHDRGGIVGLGWQNDLHLSKDHTITAGVDFAEENFKSLTSSNVTADTTGGYLQDSISFWHRLYLTAGARYEQHSDAGAYMTYRLTGAYLFPTNTKLHASLGTAFKQPTLFQLFSSFGSPTLKAEKSQGLDIGVEQSFFHDRLVADVTYFHNHFRDLVDFDFVSNKLQNVGAARTQGAELSLSYRPTDSLTLAANYTYTDTQNLQSHQQLLRRAPNKIGVDCSYRYSRKGDVTLGGVYYSGRADIDPTSFGRTKVGGYTLVNFSTSYKLNDHLTLFGRIDNLLNQHYEEVAGFGTAGISFFGGARLGF